MPGAVGCRPCAAFRFAQVRLDDPVPRIRGVRILCIAIVGDEGIGDKGVPRQETAARSCPLQIRVLEAHSGIEVGDYDPGGTRGPDAARGRIPGSHGVDQEVGLDGDPIA